MILSKPGAGALHALEHAPSRPYNHAPDPPLPPPLLAPPAGVIAIDLARQMLQLYPDTYALVVSTENITQNWYFGNDRSM